MAKSPPPLYRQGSQAVYYDNLVYDIRKRELRDGMWWYKIRYHLNIIGGKWVPENDPFLRRFP